MYCFFILVCYCLSQDIGNAYLMTIFKQNRVKKHFSFFYFMSKFSIYKMPLVHLSFWGPSVL